MEDDESEWVMDQIKLKNPIFSYLDSSRHIKIYRSQEQYRKKQRDFHKRQRLAAIKGPFRVVMEVLSCILGELKRHHTLSQKDKREHNTYNLVTKMVTRLLLNMELLQPFARPFCAATNKVQAYYAHQSTVKIEEWFETVHETLVHIESYQRSSDRPTEVIRVLSDGFIQAMIAGNSGKLSRFTDVDRLPDMLMDWYDPFSDCWDQMARMLPLVERPLPYPKVLFDREIQPKPLKLTMDCIDVPSQLWPNAISRMQTPEEVAEDLNVETTLSSEEEDVSAIN